MARWVDRDARSVAPVTRQPGTQGDWTALTTDLLGIPAVQVAAGPTLADIGCRATSGFRDQFYGFVHATHERRDRPDAPLRLVSVGMIDPLGLGWGRRPARFAGRDFVEPVVDVDALDDRLTAWVEARCGTKLLVATQTKVIEVAVDEVGDCVPLTPGDRAPSSRRLAVARGGRADQSGGHRDRVSRRHRQRARHERHQVVGATVARIAGPRTTASVGATAPTWRGALARETGDRRALLRALAETMCAAYGQPVEPLTSWWMDRLPKVALTTTASAC